MTSIVSVRAPASSANLGPGFDCLGLALDLWNEAEFQVMESGGIRVESQGEGADFLPRGADNLIIRALHAYYAAVGLQAPQHVQVRCLNRIPAGSGLGSSAAATLMGLLAADALCGLNQPKSEILRLAMEFENHGDNLGAALYGAMVVCTVQDGQARIHPRSAPPIACVVALPEYDLPTEKAREILPKAVSRADAIFNLSRALLLVEALEKGDVALLRTAMEDRIHQPYRLVLVPGMQAAFEAARSLGAAVAISGAGPALLAYTDGNPEALGEAMAQPFRAAGLPTRVLHLAPSLEGASATRLAG